MKKIISFLVLSVILVNLAFAETSIPHQFYGEVTVNGQPAPDNYLVVAKINGDEVAATYTKNGKYGYAPDIFYVRDPYGDRAGDLIEFFVNNIKGGEEIFVNGESTRLDLAITQQTTSTGGSSGSSSGSRGGSSIIVQTVNTTAGSATEDAECVPDWVCSDWLDCIDGTQKRVCVDSNKCDDLSSQPGLVQTCEVPKSAKQAELTSPEGKTETGLFGITGAFLGGGTASIAAVAIIGILLIAAGLILIKSKK